VYKYKYVISITLAVSIIYTFYIILQYSTQPKDPVTGTKPNVAFSPTQPDQQLGRRTDPPWSPPIAMSTSPVAT